ncbi:cytochrome P450 [Sorangium cellulosum]|uniref:Cytochrome P450 n=1 Tax=Sorangium cellulosum TaxID=56 RepID=A0A4P2QDK1_SORCE|nr:cytochrome P450 [Sorangium cellulosum]
MDRLPPGPKRLGPIESLQVGAITSVSKLRQLAARYGDTFRLPFRRQAVTFTGDPEALRAIYTAPPDSFDVWGVSTSAPVFGSRSLVVVTGEHHRRARKLLSPHFSAASLRAFAGVIAETAEAAARRWVPGQPFSMVETTRAISLDIMLHVVFGVRGDERVQRARAAVIELVASVRPIFILLPWLRRELGGLGPWARSQRAERALNAILLEEIHARREGGVEGKDLLTAMLSARYDDGGGMEDGEILEQLRGLLFAGHDSTALVLAWAFVWLQREPRVLERVLDEIEGLGPAPSPEAFDTLPYLGAVCQEVLRLYPPVVDVARVARRPFDLGGYTIPAGEAVRPTMTILHARPDLYPEPDRFLPERFFGRQFSPFEYIPFGGGARRCLGAAFALLEMKVVLGTLLRGHRLRLLRPERVQPVRVGFTMGPSGDVRTILEARRVVDDHGRVFTWA